MEKNVEVKDKRDHPFYQIDNRLLTVFGKRIGPYAIALYNALAYHARQSDQAWPSYRTIAEETGMSRSSVIKAIDTLVTHGLIKTEPRYNENGSVTSNLYVLVDLPPDPVPHANGPVCHADGGVHDADGDGMPDESGPVCHANGDGTRGIPKEEAVNKKQLEEETLKECEESDRLRAPQPASPINSPHAPAHDSRHDIFVEEPPAASHRNAAAVYGAIDQPEPQDKAAREAMFRALCKAAGMDGRTLKPHELNQIADASHILHKAGYVSADVERFMRDIWFNDWRWEKNRSRPTLNQIRQEIGKLHAEKPPDNGLAGRNSRVGRTMAAFDEFEAMLTERGIR